MHQQHPFKILRQFLKGHPDLKQGSTQKGFAAMADCSPSLIRAVEQGQIKITPKLAKKIHACTGVSIPWLSTMHRPDQAIPAASGGVLTHESIIAKLKEEMERNLQMAEQSLMIGPIPATDSPEAAKDPSTLMKRRMASTVAKLVEEALFESLNRGDQRMINEINRVLARSFPPDETNSDTP